MVGPVTRSRNKGHQNRPLNGDLVNGSEPTKVQHDLLQPHNCFDSVQPLLPAKTIGDVIGNSDAVSLSESQDTGLSPVPPDLVKCPLASPSVSAHPTCALRIDGPGSAESGLPVRVVSCPFPSSSTSTQPSRVMRIDRPNCSGSVHPIRVMRCSYPSVSRSDQPVRIMKYEHLLPHCSSQQMETKESGASNICLGPPPCSNLPSSDVSSSSPSCHLNSAVSCSSTNISAAAIHSKSSEQSAVEMNADAVQIECLFDSPESKANNGGDCFQSEDETNSSVKSQALKCRNGRMSSYSLRALKTIPNYIDRSTPIYVDRTNTNYGDRTTSHHVDIFGSSFVSEQHNPFKSSKCSTEDRQETSEVSIMEDTDDSHINKLPNEVLCMILAYLPRIDLLRVCSKVCQRWRQLAKSPTLWQTLSFCGTETPIDLICGFIRHSPSLKSITVKDRNDVDVILPLLHQQCKRLESVNLVRCRPTVGNHKTLRAKFLYPLLRRGQLRNLSLKGTDYRSRKFYQMLNGVTSLRKLNISCSKGVTPQILGEIAKNTTLKVFKHKWHSNSIYYGDKSMTIQLPGRIDAWVKAYTILFQGVGSYLSTLEFYAAGISDSALSNLSSCKKLKKLAVFNANCFSSEGMTAVASLLELKELLIHNAKLTTVDVANAFQTDNLSGLKCLHLNDSIWPSSDLTYDACLKVVASKCRQLQHLSFTMCASTTDIGVEEVLKNCSELISLDLNGGTGISGKSFLLIPSKTPNLKLLFVEKDCTNEKNINLKKLFENTSLKIKYDSTWKHRTTSYYL